MLDEQAALAQRLVCDLLQMEQMGPFTLHKQQLQVRKQQPSQHNSNAGAAQANNNASPSSAAALRIAQELKRMGFGPSIRRQLDSQSAEQEQVEAFQLLASVKASHPGLVAVTAKHVGVPLPNTQLSSSAAAASPAAAKDAQMAGAVEDLICSVQGYHAIALQRVTDYVPMALDLSLLVNPLKRVQSDLIPNLTQVHAFPPSTCRLSLLFFLLARCPCKQLSLSARAFCCAPSSASLSPPSLTSFGWICRVVGWKSCLRATRACSSGDCSCACNCSRWNRPEPSWTNYK